MTIDQSTSLPPTIDLTDGPAVEAVRIRVSTGDNPFASMSEQERMRIFVRVLCELVAYGEVDDDQVDDDALDDDAVAGGAGARSASRSLTAG